MKWIGLLAVAFLAGGWGAAPPSLERKEGVQALGWLEGSWHREGNGRVLEERWTPPAGGTVIGTSRLMRQGRTVFHEYMVIREEEKGVVLLLQHGLGERAVHHRYPLTRTGPQEAVFENPDYSGDRARRIVYRRSESSLTALVTHVGAGGEEKVLEVRLERR